MGFSASKWDRALILMELLSHVERCIEWPPSYEKVYSHFCTVLVVSTSCAYYICVHSKW